MTDQSNLIGLMLEGGNIPLLNPWFRAHPDIFREEKEVLETMGFVMDEAMFLENEIVAFTGILAEYPDRKLRILFPLVYPSIAPSVSDDSNCLLLPRHQHPRSREYCLFGPEGKLWSSRYTCADVLGETLRLIDNTLGESKTSKNQMDPYPEPFSAQAFFADKGVVMIPPGVSEFLPIDLDVVAEGLVKIKYDDKCNQRGVVVKAECKNLQKTYEAKNGYINIVSGSESKGKLVFLPRLERPVLNSTDLVEVLNKNNLRVLGNYEWYVLVFPEQSGDSESIRYSWLVFKKDKNSVFSPIKTITFRSSEREARIPGLRFLVEKKIAIIGCGSLGSKIAASLASSGVQKFLLVDKDIIEPSNAVRHQCGVDLFGIKKTHALAQRLISLNPDVIDDCRVIPMDPFGYLRPEKRNDFLGQLNQCDLIVNATGNMCLSRAVSEISSNLSIPSVHVSITNGAWSGEIFRYIPGETSCWRCFHSTLETSPPGQDVLHGHVFGPGCDQPTFTGAGYELDIVAGLATAFIVDTVRCADGGESEYAGDYLLWEGRDRVGKLVQKTTVHSVPRREICDCLSV